MKALYVLGAAGVGKTTALEAAFPVVGPALPLDSTYPLLVAEFIAGGRRLGRHRDRFSGTDALAMNVHPQAVAWALTGTMPALLVGEGQRLGTVAFLDALRRRTQLLVVHLTAEPAALAARRAGRTQDPRWVKASATRASRTAEALGGIGIDTTGISPGALAEVFRSLVE